MNITDEIAAQNTQDYAARHFNRVLTIDPETNAVDLSTLKDGEIALFLRTMQSQISRTRAEQGFTG